MKRTRFDRLFVAGMLATSTAVGAAAGVAHAASQTSDTGTIAVEDGNKEFLVAHAVGVQIYSCNTTADGYAWSFVAPRADLYGDNGKLVATHYGGPTWQARDGSTVKAQRVDGVTVDETAIPWLLLKKVSASPGPDGDRFVATTFIQRTATTGGIAPPAGDCNASTAGTTVEVPYTADYHFWKSTGG